MNIVLCGFMGAGKTSVGRQIAKITGRRFTDTDELVELKEGKKISQIFDEKGEDYFRELEHQICVEAAEMKNAVISTGGGAMTFQRNVDSLKEGGKIVFLDASFGVICDRIGNSKTRPLFQNIDEAKRLYDERRSKYAAAADYIIDGDMSARKTALEIAQIFK